MRSPEIVGAATKLSATSPYVTLIALRRRLPEVPPTVNLTEASVPVHALVAKLPTSVVIAFELSPVPNVSSILVNFPDLVVTVK